MRKTRSVLQIQRSSVIAKEATFPCQSVFHVSAGLLLLVDWLQNIQTCLIHLYTNSVDVADIDDLGARIQML